MVGEQCVYKNQLICTYLEPGRSTNRRSFRLLNIAIIRSSGSDDDVRLTNWNGEGVTKRRGDDFQTHAGYDSRYLLEESTSNHSVVSLLYVRLNVRKLFASTPPRILLSSPPLFSAAYHTIAVTHRDIICSKKITQAVTASIINF
jgi:hypothetical protein